MTDESQSRAPFQPTVTLPGQPLPSAIESTHSLSDTHNLPDTSGATPRPPVADAWPHVPGYEVLSLLGRGGMGAVYQARDLKLKRLVALKMILGGAQATAADLARFRLEGEAVARLHDPHIVQIYEVGEMQGQPYFALEYVKGPTLAQHLNSTPLLEVDAARLVETLARAMHVAHGQGIVHRDLKPGNVLLAEGLVPKITDFGLAKQLDDDSTRTASGVILGTPSYMAPEQAFGDNKQVGPWSDVYALGAILYECLTGRPPFRAATTIETVLQVRHDEPVSPATLRPKLPRDLVTICLKALHKSPGRRYSTALAMAEDLSRFLNQEPILARSVSSWERTWRWCRRKPLAASLLATIAVALVTIFATAAVAYSRVSTALEQESTERRKAVNAARSEKLAKNAALESAQKELVAKQKAEQASEEATRAKQSTEVALNLADENLTRSRLRLAEQYWLNNDVPEADLLLDRCPLEQRSWEWHYLKRLCHSELQVISNDVGYCTAQYSHDGRLLVAGSAKLGVQVWDAEDRQLKKTFGTDGRVVRSVAVTAGGERIAALVTPATLLIWDYETGQRVTEIGKVKTSLRSRLTFSPDGQSVVDPEGTVYDVKTGEKRFEVPPQVLDHAYFSTGELVTIGLSGVRVWNSVGEELRTLPIPFAMGLAVSRDDRWIATTQDDGFDLFDASTGSRLASFRGQSEMVRDLCFSADGRRIATACGDRTVRVWELNENLLMNRLQATLRGHAKYPKSVSFHPDGRRLASTADESVRIWDADLNPQMTTRKTDGGMLAMDRQRNRFLTYGKGLKQVVIRDCTTLSEVGVLENAGEVWSAAYSHDGRWIATGNKSGIHLWDAETLELEREYSTSMTPVTCLTFSADDQTLAAGTEDKKLRIWRLEDDELLTHEQLRENIYRLEALPGTREIAVNQGNSVFFFDHAAEKKVRVLQAERVTRFAINGPGTQIATVHSLETGVHIWDARTGDKLFNLPSKYPLGSVAFHPHEARVAAATRVGSAVSQITIWDLNSQEEVLSSHAGGAFTLVSDLSFSPSGERLFAQGAGQTRCWEAPEAEHVFALTGHGGFVRAMQYAPSGKQLAAADNQGQVRLWDLPQGRLAGTLSAGEISSWQVHYLRDEQRLLTLADKIILWNTSTRQPLLEFPRSLVAVSKVAVSHDEQIVALAGSDDKVHIRSLQNGALLQELKLHHKPVHIAAFCPDGKSLITIAGDNSGGELVIWDLTTFLGRLINHPVLLRSLAMHPTNGTFVTNSDDGSLLLWNADGTIEQTLREPSQERFFALAWSPDGNILAAGSNTRFLDLWDMTTCRRIASRLQSQPVLALAFSPKGDHLAVGLQSDSIHILPVSELVKPAAPREVAPGR